VLLVRLNWQIACEFFGANLSLILYCRAKHLFVLIVLKPRVLCMQDTVSEEL